MIAWFANVLIGMGEQMLTEQQRAERGGITIHAEQVHISGPTSAAEVVEKLERVGLRDRLRFTAR